MGRGKYHHWRTADGLRQLREMAAAGLTDTQIAERIGVRRQTIYDWINAYPDISDALAAGRAMSDDAVEGATHLAALGYYVDETTIERDAGGKIVSKTTRRRWVRPDMRAALAWLARRRWREDQVTEQEAGGVVVVPSVETDASSNT